MSKLSLLEIAQSQLDKTPVIDGQLIVCLDTGNAYRDTATAHVKIGSDLEVVSDLPLAPLAEKIYYLKPDKLYAYLGGNWTLLNDKTIDLDKVIAKLPAGSSTALNDDVEIITQDTDTTQAHYYRRKLVVIWEYIKTKAQDFFAAKNHKHKKADITDFPTSMPASDVYPWAKAAKKPSYTKAEIGLGKVDNTADADKTVKRATTAGTADSANSVAWENVKDKPTTFPVEAHNHDDRYYTEAEVNSKLNNKVDNTEAGANGLINKLESGTAAPVDNDLIITQWANHTTATAANQNRYVRRPMSSIWSYIKSKADSVYQPKGSYAASGHTHDDRYYTESEVNTKLANYQPKGNYAAASHTHNYAGSGTAGGSANSAVKLDSSAGSATQPVYFKDGKPVATTYALNKTVPADAKFTDTNTWRGIQNNLTSDSTDQSLSAAQGKALKTLVDGKAPTSHTHTKSQITDFPSSMPASDVYAWAKAATKPSYTKAEVGLGNVDNTADKNKSVNYATSAGSATNAQCLNNDDKYMKFHWSGQKGQPTWLWGGNDSGDMYVYNPSNFNVNYATTAGTALTAKNLPYSITYEGSYVGTARRDYLYSNDGPNYATETNPIRTTLSKEYDIVVFLEGWSCPTNETCPEKNAFLCLMNDTKFTQSYVVMSALTNEWTRGLSRLQSSGDVAYGPVIEYGNSPKKSIKYRKNGTSIERYWTREKINSSGSLGEPGSENNLDNGAYMLLDRPGKTYHVFGIDIDHRFFVSSHADEEGSEVV